MDIDAAGRLGLGWLGWVDDGDVLGTTALRVLDSSTRLGAGRAVLASGTVGHVVVELQVAVKLGLEGDGSERELVNVGTATERRRSLLLAAAGTADLVLVSAGSKTLASTIAVACPSLPVEVVVVKEVSGIQVGEVEAGVLLIRALVVRVTGARERVGVSEAL